MPPIGAGIEPSSEARRSETGTPFPEIGAALQALQRLMRPLVRVLLRNGIAFGTFNEVCKKVFVEVAHEDFPVEGRKPSIAHTSVLTGLTRKEVSRLLKGALPELDLTRYNRAARVATGWALDKRFSDPEKGPLLLAFDSGRPSFTELVKAYSGDMPARSVLDELLRTGAVVEEEDGRIRLLHRAYVPGSSVAEKLGILGTDVADLISSIDHNMTAPGPERFFQRKVAYDNLVVEGLEPLRVDVAERAQRLLEELNGRLRPLDRDANPDLVGRGHGRGRAMVGIYYYESRQDSEERE